MIKVEKRRNYTRRHTLSMFFGLQSVSCLNYLQGDWLILKIGEARNEFSKCSYSHRKPICRFLRSPTKSSFRYGLLTVKCAEVKSWINLPKSLGRVFLYLESLKLPPWQLTYYFLIYCCSAINTTCCTPIYPLLHLQTLLKIRHWSFL